MREEKLSDNVRLILGDAREVVPTLKGAGIDAMVTDSPYGIQDLVGGYGRTQLTTGVKGTKMDARRVNDLRIHNDRDLKVVGEVFALARSIMNKNAWVAAFYSCRITPRFFKDMSMFTEDEYFGEMIWNKKAPGLGTQVRYCHENVAFWRLGKPEPLADCMSLFEFAALKGTTRSEGSSHPHEKPDKVMDNVVSVVPGKVILDPFCGTGSTGAAAVRAKRGFVGIELDPKYFDVACAKVAKALATPTAFWE